MINNNDLKKASKNFLIEKEELYNDIMLINKNKAKHLRLHPMRRLTALVVALSVIFGGCITAYAVSPELRNHINLWFMTDSKRQDKVPEGYKGVYTIEDLNNIRNNLSENYILMNDLAFSDSDFDEGGAYAGGWAAIGDDNSPFGGIFDGNGHVISNLKLNAEGIYTGLFGKIFYNSNNSEFAGMIKSLGLNNVTVNATISDNSSRYIGSVVAFGRYVVSCYADNVKINVTVKDFESKENNTHTNILIGGICGRSYAIDSCYADAEIKISDTESILQQEICISVGGISALAYYSVTSYFKGIITCNGKAYGSCEVLSYNPITPIIMSETRYNTVIETLRANCKETLKANHKEPRTIRTFQVFYIANQFNQTYKYMFLNNVKASGKYYVLEPLYTLSEIIRLDKILLECFDEEQFRNDTFNEGVKNGMNFCYTLEQGKSYEQSYFEQFDFENIWVMKDGVPKLQIFE